MDPKEPIRENQFEHPFLSISLDLIKRKVHEHYPVRSRDVLTPDFDMRVSRYIAKISEYFSNAEKWKERILKNNLPYPDMENDMGRYRYLIIDIDEVSQLDADIYEHGKVDGDTEGTIETICITMRIPVTIQGVLTAFHIVLGIDPQRVHCMFTKDNAEG